MVCLVRLPENFGGEFERPLDKHPVSKMLTALLVVSLPCTVVLMASVQNLALSQLGPVSSLLPKG